MRLRTFLTGLALGLTSATASAGVVVIPPAPLSLAGRVGLAATPEKATLDRVTGQLTTTATVTLTNSGDRPITGPLRVLVSLSPAGVGKDVTIVGSLSPDEYSQGLSFYDLTSQIGTGLAPGASVSFVVALRRPSGISVSYQLSAQGLYNRDPIANAEVPPSGTVGDELTFDASLSSDPDNDPLTYAWEIGSATRTGVSVPYTFTTPGLQEIALTVTDIKGATNRKLFSVNVRPSGNIALARTRVLDSTGFTLGGVTILETLGGTAQPDRSNDPSSGFASLGGSPGLHVWKFQKTGFLPAWRKASLTTGNINVLPDPWLSPHGPSVELSPLSALTVATPDASTTLVFPAGSFASNGQGALTALAPTTLPFPLPYGWSPLGQFHWSATATQTAPITAALNLADSLRGETDTSLLVRFDETALVWTVVSGVYSQTNTVTFPFTGTGSFAVVVADSGLAFDAFTPGDLLPSASFSPSESYFGSATGTLSPEKSVANTDAAAVTSQATVDVQNPDFAPSGVYLPTTLEETYRLADSRTLRTPDLDRTIPAYQRPGPAVQIIQVDQQIQPAISGPSLRARFSLRPWFLFGPEDLTEAVLRAQVLAPSEFAGAALTPAGGILARDGWRVIAGDGTVTRPAVGELRTLRTASFASVFPGVTVLQAAELNLADLIPGMPLLFETQGLAPNSHFVLARLTLANGDFGLQPLLRGTSDATGRFASSEPAVNGLPGITRGGILVLAQTPAPLGLVSGIVQPLSGGPIAGLTVKVDGSPWLAVTGPGGSYLIAAPVGNSQLTAFDSRDSNEGRSPVTIPDAGSNVTLNLNIGPTGPRVLSTVPAASATNVSVVTAVRVRFSEPVTAASFGTTGLSLTGDDNAVVPSAISLNLAGTEAQLLPTDPLAAGITHTIHVSPTLADSQGNVLAGPATFTFTTQLPTVRGESAQLVIYEPGATAVPPAVLAKLVGYNPVTDTSAIVVEGTAGVADPEVPVILINENTGETATVLSKPDGSFANFLHGSAEDLFSATFVNANGTRVAIPLKRQIFDDGRIGLYRSGGTIQNTAGNVELTVEPNAIGTRTVFEVQALTLAQTITELGGVSPASGAVLLAGLKLQSDGDASAAPAKLKFNLALADLLLPPEENSAAAAFALALVRNFNGVKVFEVIDRLTYTDGALQTSGAPFRSLTWSERDQQFLVLLKIANADHAIVSGRVVTALNGSADPATGAHQLLPDAAVFFGPSTLPANGLLAPGAVVSVTGADGTFALLAPVSAYETLRLPLFAASARFPGLFATSGVQATIEATSPEAITSGLLVFNRSTAGGNGSEDVLVPALAVSINPGEPATATAAEVILTATDDRSTPVFNVAVESTTAFTGGENLAPSEITLTRTALDNFPTSTVQTFSLTSPKAGSVFLRVNATDVAGNLSSSLVCVSFGTTPPAPVAPNPADLVHPSITAALPTANAVNVNRFDPITLSLSEAINPAFLSNPSGVFTLSPAAGLPLASISPDNRTVTLRYPALQPGVAYTLFVGSGLGGGLRDLAGNLLDQVPGGAPDAFLLRFSTAPLVSETNLGVVSGAGIVGNASRLFALDRGTSTRGSLRSFTRDGLGNLTSASVTELPGQPRDLLFIPKYPFILGNQIAQTKDLVVIIGGYSTAVGVGGSLPADSGPWIAVYDVENPATPVRLVSEYLGTNAASALTKLDWSAPHLGLLETSADSSKVLLVNLQLMLYAFNSTPGVGSTPANPDVAYAGLDVNSDGDYVDAGERIPLPSGILPRLGLINGGLVKTLSLPAGDTRQLQDFSLALGGSRVVGVLRSSDSKPAALRFLSLGGSAPDASQAEVTLPAVPRRVLHIHNVSLQVAGAANRTAHLAVVSSATGNALRVYDVTDPLLPALLNTIALPLGSNENLWTPKLAPNGQLIVASSRNLWHLDPARLGLPAVAGAPPALLGQTPDFGSSTRAYVTDGANFHALNHGSTTKVSK